MNTAVANILNSVLGEWIENIDSNDLRLSVITGNVTLRNLRIKSDAMKQLTLPYIMKSGYVGKINAKIAWGSLGSNPLKIVVEDVYVLLGPKHLDKWDAEIEKQSMIDGKLSMIEKYELVNQDELTVKKEPGYMDKIIQGIIDNLQISVQRIYIRYEDDMTPDQKFAFGLKLKGLSAYTTNYNWQKEYTMGSSMTYKLAMMRDMSVYLDYGEEYLVSISEKSQDIEEDFKRLAIVDLDAGIQHRYVMNPVEFDLKILMNKNTHDLSLPHIQASLSTGAFKFDIYAKQVTYVLKILDFLAYFDKFKKGIEREMNQRNLDGDEAMEYRELYKKLKQMKDDSDPQAEQIRNQMKDIESTTYVSNIINNRKAVMHEIELDRLQQEKQAEISKLEKPYEPGAMDKIKGFLWTKPEEQKQQEQEQRQEKLYQKKESLKKIQEQHEDLKENVGEYIKKEEEKTEIPEEYVQFLVNLDVNSISLYIADDEQSLAKLNIERVKSEVGIRVHSIYAKMKVEGSNIADLVVKSPVFPYIVRGGFLSMEYDQMPHTILRMQSGFMRIVMNPECVLRAIGVFQNAFSQHMDYSQIQDVASQKAAQYAEQSQQLVKQLSTTGIQSRIELHIALKAPEIFLPLDLNSLNKPMLVLDMGMLQVTTSEASLYNMEYDRYSARLDPLKLVTVWNCQDMEKWYEGDFKELISPIRVELNFDNCRKPTTEAPGFILRLGMSSVDLTISDEEIIFTLELINHILLLQKEFMSTQPNLPKPVEHSDSMEIMETEATQEQNLDIPERKAFKDSLKNIGDIISSRIELVLEGSTITLRDKHTEFLKILVQGIKSSAQLNSQGSISLEFYLEKVEILDRRERVVFNRIIYNPLVYKESEEDEFKDAQEVIYQVKAVLDIKPLDDLYDLFVTMSDLRIVISADLISALNAYMNSKMVLVQKFFKKQAEKKQKNEYHPGAPKTQMTTHIHRRFSARLTNFEVLIPKNIYEADTKIADLHFGVTSTYVSTQEFVKYFDSNHIEIRTDYKKADDEGTLEVMHLGVMMGYLRNEQVIPPPENLNDLISPSRLMFNLKCLKDPTQNINRITCECGLESLLISAGLKDVSFFLQIGKQLSSIDFSKNTEYVEPTPEQKEQMKQAVQQLQEVEFILSIGCDALHFTLLDDTGKNSYSLLKFQFSNMSNVLHTIGISITYSMSALILAHYFNISKATWEPFIEDWMFNTYLTNNGQSDSFEVFFTSKHLLNINITYSMAEMLATLYRILKIDYDKGSIKRISSKQDILSDSDLSIYSNIYYNIQNNLGVPIQAWIDIGKDVEKWDIQPNDTQTFSQELLDKLYSSHRIASKNTAILNTIQTPATIAIYVEGYSLAKGLIIEGSEVVGFHLHSARGEKIPCVMMLYSKGNNRNISVESAVTVMNNSKIPVTLNWEDSSMTVNPYDAEPLPLKWLDSIETPYITSIDLQKVYLKNPAYIKLLEGNLTLDLTRYQTTHKIPQTIFQLNPSLSFQNLCPCVLQVYIDDKLDPFLSLDIGCEVEVMNVDMDIPHAYQFKLVMEDNLEVCTDFITITNNQEAFKLSGNFPASHIFVNYEEKEFKWNKKLDLRFREIAYEEEMYDKRPGPEAKVLKIYPQLIINNHTDYFLECGKRTRLRVNPHALCFYKSSRDKTKVKITSSSYGVETKWSSSFNINSVGLSGVIALDNTDAADAELSEQLPKQILLGMRIQAAPDPLIKSNLLHIVPRFMIKNHLGYDIYIRQYFSDELPKLVLKLERNQFVPYQLEDSKKDKIIQISSDNHNWSTPFPIEDIEDFQIRYLASPSQYEPESEYHGMNVMKRLLGKTEHDWYKPSSLNNYMHFSRVAVLSEDEATIYINFLVPKDPEFVIWNMTDQDLVARQLECKEHIIRAKTRIPWSYDNYLASNKRIEIRCGLATQNYSLEKIKKMKDLGDFDVEVIVCGVTREMRIRNTKQPRQSTFSLRNFLTNYQKKIQSVKIWTDLAGVSLSFIDERPREKFYFVASGVRSKLKMLIETVGRLQNTEISIDLKLDHAQMDNMDTEGRLFPVILSTSGMSSEDNTPFFQAKVRKMSSTIRMNKDGSEVSITSMERWRWLEVQLQEMNIHINQESINDILKIVGRLQVVFDGGKSSQKKIRYEPVSIHEISSDFNSELPVLKYDPHSSTQKAYFEFVHLGAMKTVITFRATKELFELEINPLHAIGAFRVFSSIGKSFITITDSPLYFSEILLRHSFQTMDTMTWLIIKNYIRQGVLQFYKVIGSSDLLGNPVGFVDKLGTGVYEFINEPRKGMLKGPKGFVEGVGKGVRSLVGNAVSAGFGSLGKIAGSLYTVVKEVGHDEKGLTGPKETQDVVTGMATGFKEGASDLAHGVTGVITRPVKGAQKGGAKGFVRGVGTGLLGVVTAPFAAILRVGDSLATGIANTGTLIARGKIESKGRLRFPRQFGARRVLEPYNSEIAQSQELLYSMPKYRKESMVYYIHIQEEKDIIIILTNKHFLLLTDAELTNTLCVKDITACEVHYLEEKFYLCILAGEKQLNVKSSDYSSLAKMYSAISSLPTKMYEKQVIHDIRVKKSKRGCLS